jgi:hypothetical protein
MYPAFGEILSRKRRAFPFAAHLMTVLIALINRDLPSHISTAQFPFAIRVRYIRFSRRAPRLGHYPIDKARSCRDSLQQTAQKSESQSINNPAMRT